MTTPAPTPAPASGDPATEPATDLAAQPTETPTDQPEDKTDWKLEARKWEQRAKENKQAAAELEKQRKASMTEAERAVAEAEARGRTTATQEYGKRLARSEIRAAAAGADANLDGVFDYLDLGRFVTEDGEPDEKAIGKFVDSLPKKTTPVPSFDGGSRSPAPAGASMNDVIRRSLGRG